MATVRVDLELRTTGEDSLKRTATGLDGVGAAAKRADASLNSWTATQQRAALRMNAMQEAAIKMNQGFTSSDDKAQLFAGTLSKVSTTATSTAASLGLPIGPLNSISAAADVAGLGLNKLSTTMVGFNSASVGVVGAGLAIGGSIGTMLRQVDFVADSFDEGVGAIWDFVAGVDALPPKLNATEQAALNAAAAIKNGTARLIELTQAAKDLSGPYANTAAEQRRMQDEIDKGNKDLEDNAAAWKKNGEAAERASEKAAAAAKKAAEEEVRLQQWAVNTWLLLLEKEAADAKAITERQLKDREDFYQKMAEKAKAFAEATIKANQDVAKIVEANDKRLADAEQARMADRALLASNLRDLSDLFSALGISADNAFAQIVSGFAAGLQAANVFQAATAALGSGSFFGGAAAGAGYGSQFGLPGMLIGGAIGGILGIFGKGKKEAAEAQKMLDDFLRSAGGIDALRAAADKAGVSLDALWDAKKPKEMEKAIADVQRQLDLFGEAWGRVDEAAQRYGLTLADTTAGSAAQAREMAKNFEQIYGDYQLLIAAGYDQQAVLEKMAPSINEWVNAAKRSGAAIPESMRTIMQAMVNAGLLTDEFGNKLTNLDGFTFSKSLTDSIGDIVTAINALVTALQNGVTGAQDLNAALGNISSGVQTFNPPPGWEPKPLAEGGYVPPIRGGRMFTLGEGGEGEYVIPEHKMGKMGMGGGSVALHSTLNVNVDGGGNVSEEVLARKITALWVNNTGGILDRAKAALGQRRFA